MDIVFYLTTGYPPPFRTTVAIVDLRNLNGVIQNELLSTHLLWSILRQTNPTFLLGRVDTPVEIENYKNYGVGIGHSILALFSPDQPGSVYVPCVPCDTAPRKDVISEVGQISSLWTKYNKNMHRQIIEIPDHDGVGTFVKEYCGPVLLSNYSISTLNALTYVTCLYDALGRHFNLTFKSISQIKFEGVKYRKVGGFNSAALLTPGKIEDIIKHKSDVIVLSFNKFRLYFITQKLEDGNVFEVLSPFDALTWYSVILASILITMLVVISDGFGVYSAIPNLLSVAVLLLGQVDTNVDKLFGRIRLLLGIWSLGCFILMGNLYWGPIFSELVAPYPPHLPGSWTQLLNSDMRLVTLSSVVNSSSGQIISLFELELVHELKRTRSLEKAKELEKARTQLAYFNVFTKLDNLALVRNMSDSIPVRDGETEMETKTTFAAIDPEEETYLMTTPLALLGQRQVIRSGIDIPLTTTTVAVGNGNFFAERFSKGVRALMESHIFPRWEAVTKMGNELKTLATFEADGKRFFLQLSMGVRKRMEVTNSLKYLKSLANVLRICGVALGLSGGCFLGEIASSWRGRDVLKGLKSKMRAAQ